MTIRIRPLTIALLMLTTACSQQSEQKTQTPSLAKVYSDAFSMGAAIDHQSYKTHRSLLIQHFNSVVAENEMKFESLQPKEGEFTFETADKMIDFAKDNGMTTRGHALIWHRQTPSWVFTDEAGNTVSKAVVRQRMRDHIFTVAKHFFGRIDAWDVVNEAIMDDGRYRTANEEGEDQQSHWYGVLGADYIEEAFRLAREADPKAKLFYNDYYNYLPAKRDAIYTMLKDLLAKGVPIDGVGLQCHLNIQPSEDPKHQSYFQTIENLEKTIRLYSSLGLDVHVTELDVSVYIGGKNYDKADYFTPRSFTQEVQLEQAQRYQELFEMFYRNREVISNVTFWGIADDNTWLSEFDSGRQDFPLLFDIHRQPKPAFDSVIQLH